MTIKKFILGVTVCAGLFALSVPSSLVLARECEKCQTETMTNPSNASCQRCHRTMDKCKCKKQKRSKCGCPVEQPACPVSPACPVEPACPAKPACPVEPACPSGCAVPACPTPTCEGGAAAGCVAAADCEKPYRQQMYAYPNAIYTNANTAYLGEENNSALIADDTSIASSGLLVTEGSMTGAACAIDAPCPLDALTAKKCPSGPKVSVDSQTSILVTRKFFENYDLPKITGAAAGMGAFYPDVPSNFWAAKEINRLSDKCVLFGYPDGLFRPNRNISRAEMATAVVKGYNLENTAATGYGSFPDVPSNHWAYEMINKGVSSEMIEGHANGKFAPEQPITIAQALTIIAKGCTCPMDDCKANDVLSKYSDGDKVPGWARIGVAKAIESGALKSDRTGNYIHPNKNASRAEVAMMLQSMRIACGYDTTDNKVAEDKVIRSFLEKEEKIQIPTLELTMNDIINSKNANVGESFAATTVNDICIDGVTYPAGSRVNGKVVEVIRPTKDDQGALRLAFNEIISCGECKEKVSLPKQVMTARVEKSCKEMNGFVRAIEFPFTWTGAVLGNTGRAIGGMAIGLSNATENVFDSVGTGTAEILTGKFRAGGRSYQNAAKALVMAPVDFTRTAASGVAGAFQTSLDEFAYLVDPSGNKISQVNPNQKVTIAFGE